MSKQFKVGDRVCYRWTDNQLRKGVISSISKDGRVEMKPIEKSLFLDSWVAHVSWLKRLVKKKRRSIWVNPNDAAGPVERHSGVFYTGLTFQDYSCNGWIEFREVKRK